MTLRLILTRHAKSDWDDDRLDDHDRPLNRRGQMAAPAIGRWLAGQGYLPDQVLCSTALRTRETWHLIAAELPARPKVAFLPDLYLAGAQRMLDLLRKRAKAPCVMLIGHNPGTAATAAMLARDRPDDPDFGRFPTCFTAIFDFDMPGWASVDWGTGTVTATMAARRLI